MSPLSAYSDLLWRLKRSSPKGRVVLIKQAPDGFIDAVVKVAIDAKRLKRLPRKAKDECRRIRNARRRGNPQARKVLTQKGGVIPLFLAALAPLIAKAAIGVGASAAGAAATYGIKKAINKK